MNYLFSLMNKIRYKKDLRGVLLREVTPNDNPDNVYYQAKLDGKWQNIEPTLEQQCLFCM